MHGILGYSESHRYEVATSSMEQLLSLLPHADFH